MTNTLIASIKSDVRDVRPLLPITSEYIVPMTTLVASIGSQIVDEQHEHYVRETVAWALARFNVMPISGGKVAKSITGVSVDVEARIIEAIGSAKITHAVAVKAVFEELAPLYGHQARVRGWVPGHKTASGGQVLEITDDPCPRCTVNPLGFRAGDARIARCLNSEDCGWTNAK